VIVEQQRQVLPGFDREIAEIVETELRHHDVGLELGATVGAIEEQKGGLVVKTDSQDLRAEVVLVAVGVRPRVELAQRAGIALGATGAIAVDDRMRTNESGIFAAGDCAEAHHLILGKPVYVPLGTTANKQGKVAGANAAGADARFPGIVGSAGFKVFDIEVARTGTSPAEAGDRALRVVSEQSSRGHAYPGASKLKTVLTVDRETGLLLGAQMAGAGVVAMRIDVYATALHAGLSVDEIAGLDLVYAPPLAPVYDPILIAATVAGKALAKAVA
jgi:NADPH-dependent 2,4-dienoyl-CoA reductase/sulfur reductase-like enzyme